MKSNPVSPGIFPLILLLAALPAGTVKSIPAQLLEADRKAVDAGYADDPCISGIIIRGSKTLKLNQTLIVME